MFECFIRLANIGGSTQGYSFLPLPRHLWKKQQNRQNTRATPVFTSPLTSSGPKSELGSHTTAPSFRKRAGKRPGENMGFNFFPRIPLLHLTPNATVPPLKKWGVSLQQSSKQATAFFNRCSRKRHTVTTKFREFIADDILIGEFIGGGAQSGVLKCTFKADESCDTARCYALKLGPRFVVKPECLAYEDLCCRVPDVVVPYLGRYYVPSSAHCSAATTPSADLQKRKNRLGGFVMEYMPNRDMFHLLHLLQFKEEGKRAPLHPSVARWYVMDILNSLYAIHRCGYYHGDVKPENLMLKPDGHVVFTDFGATRKDVEENWNMHDFGTRGCQAPEVCCKIPIPGPRRPSDLWSVGILLFDMLFGYFPYTVGADDVYQATCEFVEGEKWPIIYPSDLHYEERQGGLAFLKRLLVLNPSDRIKWPEIFSHEWLKNHWKAVQKKKREAPLVIEGDEWAISHSWSDVIDK